MSSLSETGGNTPSQTQDSQQEIECLRTMCCVCRECKVANAEFSVNDLKKFTSSVWADQALDVVGKEKEEEGGGFVGDFSSSPSAPLPMPLDGKEEKENLMLMKPGTGNIGGKSSSNGNTTSTVTPLGESMSKSNVTATTHGMVGYSNTLTSKSLPFVENENNVEKKALFDSEIRYAESRLR